MNEVTINYLCDLCEHTLPGFKIQTNALTMNSVNLLLFPKLFQQLQ